MKELIERTLDAAQRGGAAYADVRVVERVNEGITVKNGALEAASSNASAGFGVRVLADGAWGFSSSSILDADEAERVTREALEIALASRAAQRAPVQLDETPAVKDTYTTPVEEDPFSVSLDEKLRILLEADAAMAAVPGAAIREGNMVAGRERKTFASLAGAWIEQEIVEAGGGIEVTAVNDSEMQQRSYPNSFGGQSVTGGFEAVRALDLPAHGQECAELAVALLDAPQCPSGEMDLVLDSTQVALQIHESCGHPTELDRVFGTEASFAGTSFLTTDKLDQLRYGSDLVNIDADATAPGGLGTFGYDDEGVAAQKSALISGGLLVGYLTSRETAPRIGRRSMGSARAWTWSNIPLIRMTNINLRPGDAGSPRRSHRRHPRWHLHEHQQELVDRRSPPELPVRRPGRLADQERQAHQARQESDVHRHHAAVLGQLRRDLRARRVDAVGAAELRQGRAGADRARRPRRRAGSLPRREGRGGAMVATGSEVSALLDRVLEHSTSEATEALYLGQDAALTRFANNQIHQNMREHDATVQVRVVDRERIGVASTNRLDEAGLRSVVERATAIAERSQPNPRAAILPEADGRSHDPELGFVAATADAGAVRAR